MLIASAVEQRCLWPEVLYLLAPNALVSVWRSPPPALLLVLWSCGVKDAVKNIDTEVGALLTVKG